MGRNGNNNMNEFGTTSKILSSMKKRNVYNFFIKEVKVCSSKNLSLKSACRVLGNKFPQYFRGKDGILEETFNRWLNTEPDIANAWFGYNEEYDKLTIKEKYTKAFVECDDYEILAKLAAQYPKIYETLAGSSDTDDLNIDDAVNEIRDALSGLKGHSVGDSSDIKR